MSTRLEHRYRALLRVLPRWYRAEREEEMVASFLDGRAGHADADLDAEHGWPGWAEAGATLALAARTRLAGRSGTGELGASVRLAGLFGLLTGIVMAAASVVSAMGIAPFMSLWTLVHAASAAALIALVRGAWLEAKILAAVPALPGLVAVVLSFGPGGAPWAPALTVAFVLPAVATAVFLSLAFTADVRTRPDFRWLWAGAGAALTGALLVLLRIEPLVVAPAALLTVAALRVSRVWTVAAALCAAAMLPYAVLLAAIPGIPPWPRWTLVTAAACLALVTSSPAWTAARAPRATAVN
ncbi:hypothetical protein ACTG9Q_26635 [Actinokineospora sp. 24-640]